MSSVVCAFDFDGTLADTYSCLRGFYMEFVKEYRMHHIYDLVNILLYYEDLYDACRMPHNFWWPKLFSMLGLKVNVELLIQKFWEYRINHTRLFDDTVVLDKLSSKCRLVILCYRDEVPGLKIKRIKRSGLDKYFERIYIIGDNVKDHNEAIKDIVKFFNVVPRRIFIIDDKPEPLMFAKISFPEINTVNITRYRGIPWIHPFKPDYRISNLSELIHIVSSRESR